MTVITPPTIDKAFSPNPLLAGGISALTFTLRNPAANTVALTGVGFSDTFPAGLTIASVPNASQCNGTVTSTANSVILSGGSIPVNGTCTVTVTVIAAAGSYLNLSDAVTSANGGTGNTASATLTVIAPPSISKSFSSNSVNVGDTPTLTFTVTNPLENTVALSGVAFTDIYPFGLTNATPLATTNTCGGTLSAVAGDNTISLSGGSLPVNDGTNGICTVSVTVLASAGGTSVNTSSPVTSTNGGSGNTASATLTVDGGGLSLVKSAASAGYQAAGDTIHYNYLLTNTGSVPLYPPYAVSDDKAGVTCPATPPSLDPLETVTCTAAYTVQAADITAKYVTNTATATAQDADSGGNTVTSNQSSVTVRLEGLSLLKSAVTGGYRSAGNTLTYSYTLTNTGAVILYPPFQILDDHMGAAFTCGSPPSLTPGANVACQKNYTVLAGDVTSGSVTNTASATAQDSGGSTVSSNQSIVTVYAVAAPAISKAFSPNTIPVGTTSTLTFTITNPITNTVPLTGVGFTDTFPAGLTVGTTPLAAQCGGAVSSSANSITLSGGTILPNSSCTVTVSVIGTTTGSKNNVSDTVSSTNGGAGNTASATLNVVSPPVITKSFSPITTSVGGVSTLTFSLAAPAGNTVALTGVAFTDNLPGGMQVANPPNAIVSAGCGAAAFAPATGEAALAFSNGTIAVGGTCTLNVNVTPTSAGTFDNTSNAVTSTNGGTGATSNTATLTVDEFGRPLGHEDRWQAGREPRRSRGLYGHRQQCRPQHCNRCSGLRHPPCPRSQAPPGPAAAGAGAACTASGAGSISDTVNLPAGSNVTYTITAAVSNTAATDIVNSASVIAPPGVSDSDPANNSAGDIDTLDRLTIAKSANPATYSAVGETITYSYTITNDGTSTFDIPFSVVDDKVTPICSAPALLAPALPFPARRRIPLHRPTWIQVL